MVKKKKSKKKFIYKLRNKYKLVILNADTFEEKFSLKLSPMNVFVITGSISILLIFLTTYIIAFTPLREYIPGYASTDVKVNLYKLITKTDSLEEAIKAKDLYIQNIKNIILGQENEAITNTNENQLSNYSQENTILKSSKKNNALTTEVENLDNNLKTSPNYKGSISIKDFFFFSPVKGIIINFFNPANNHYGIDIVSKKNEAIKATLDGTVIFSGWTFETGNVIIIQHPNNIISVYKHNSALLKKQGAYVKAGEPIAIIGETGELSTGPHLHFELWFNGNPVNPKDYIVF
ncbi:MAG TPA: M23 family metallopeptidase [Bacteroidales bacterium]|nr:M23 family metallopeptidase [Bacteroidales bacterium]